MSLEVLNQRPMFKVNASLINSYLSMKNGKYKDSEKQFMSILNREKLEKTFIFKRGDAFEKSVTVNPREPFHETVKGCKTQHYIQKVIPLQDRPFDIKITGFADFVKPDESVIYDTKRVTNWSQDGAYDDSVQHLFYLLAIDNSKEFYYLVGAGSKWFPDTYYEVKYTKDSTEEIEKQVMDVIKDFLDYLEKKDLLEIYKKNYNADSSVYYKKEKEGERK